MIKLFVFRLFCYRTLSSPHQRSFAPFFCFFFRFLFFRFCSLNFVCSGFSVAFVVCLCVACRTCLPLLRPAAASQAVYLLPEHSSPNLTYLFIRFDLSFFYYYVLYTHLTLTQSGVEWSEVLQCGMLWHGVAWCVVVARLACAWLNLAAVQPNVHNRSAYLAYPQPIHYQQAPSILSAQRSSLCYCFCEVQGKWTYWRPAPGACLSWKWKLPGQTQPPRCQLKQPTALGTSSFFGTSFRLSLNICMYVCI